MFIFSNTSNKINPNIKSLITKYENEFDKEIYFNEIIQISNYEKNNKKALLSIKLYHKKSDINWFLKYLEKALIHLDTIVKLDKENTLITYVPLNIFQFVYRWYSHVYLSAKKLEKLSKMKLIKTFNKKISFKKQSSLNKKERHTNLKDRFKLRKWVYKQIKDKDIILVDDIVASWVTINILSKILKKAWARNIYVIVLAWSTWESL